MSQDTDRIKAQLENAKLMAEQMSNKQAQQRKQQEVKNLQSALREQRSDERQKSNK